MISRANSQQHLILASASPRRQQLLRQLGLSFTVMPADLDEAAWMDPVTLSERDDTGGEYPQGVIEPAALAMRLAILKARTVSERLERGLHPSGTTVRRYRSESRLILAADTLVLAQGRILGKPGDVEEACAMLRQLSGRQHEVITGLCLLKAETREHEAAYESTKVFFRTLRDEEIEAYVLSGEAMDKAGAYGIQGYGAVFVERIEGCYYNVVGLPLTRLVGMLSRQGVRLVPGKGDLPWNIRP